MENYAAYNYPDSGNSSPRSREIDFDNSWEEPSLSTSSTGSINNLKAKFMVSYGGKIQPRQHDNQLSYVGGETKILAVDRSIRFSSLIGKLSSLFPEAGACGDVSFKYQLPGEDLDALISVTNDDDLDHLIHEYDRLNRSSSKPARLRLFLFSASQPHAPPPSLHHSRDHAAHHHHTTAGQFGSGDSVKSDRERMFVDALNSAAQPPPPTAVPVPPPVAAAAVTNNVDYLFGLEKGIGVGVPAQMHAVSPPPPPSHHLPKLHDPIPDPDYGMPDPQIEARIQELNRLQLSANQQQQLQQQLQQQFHQQQQVQHQQQQVHHHQQLQQQQQMLYQAAAKNEENLVNAGVDPGYGQRYPDKFHQQQPQQTFPAGYWPPDQKNMVTSGGFQSTIGVEQQPVYMIPAATGAVYHTPVMRSVPQGMSAPPPPQQHQQQQQAAGYYPVQRVQAGGEVYRDMPVYGVVSTAPTVPSTVSPQVQRMATGGGYSGEGVGMQQMRQVPGGEMGGYAQVAYDGATGRQVYYATPPTGVGSGGGSTGGGGSVPVATPYQVAAAGGPAPAAAVVSNSNVVTGGGEGRSSGGGESVGGGGKAVPKVSPNSGTV